MTILEWAAFALGLVIVIGTLISVIKTLVVPRRAVTELLVDTIAAPRAPWSGTRSFPTACRSAG